MKFIRMVLISALLVCGLVGCQPASGKKVVQNKETKVSYQVLSGAKMPSEIAGWLKNNRGFEQSMLVDSDGVFYAVITRGKKSTGGYGVGIKDMTLLQSAGKSKLTIRVLYKDPKPGAVNTQVITYPSVIAKVNLKQKPGEIKFEIVKS